MMRKCCSIIADLLAVAGFGLSLFIACRIFPNNDNTHFDYQAIIVGIVAAIFTLLVGWNIYQMVDWNQKIKRLDTLQSDVEKQINFIHNKADFNQACTYAFLCQQGAVQLLSRNQEISKYQMVQFGLNSIKIYSSLPGTEKETQSIIGSMVECLKQTSEIVLSDKYIDEILLLCGSIPEFQNIKGLDEIIRLTKGK